MKARNISMGEIMARQTIEVEFSVTGIRWFKFRLWLAARIIKLATLVMGCNLKIKEPPCRE